MKKLICIISFIIGLSFYANAVSVSAKSAIVIDSDTYEVLYQKDSDVKLSMASTTKIITAIIALDGLDLEKIIKIKPEYTKTEGSSMYLKPGEEISIRDLIYGLMLTSGNDAAIALACETSGSVGEFVKTMNQKAKDIGLKNTSFETPNGLDGENHYTTGRELAIITAYAMKNIDFRDIVSTKNYNSSGRYMKNHNKLLWQYEDAIGVKTGFTKKSGRCLVSAAQRNGREIICVTLNAPSDWSDHKKMLDYGFSQYQDFNIVGKDDIIISVPVISGIENKIDIKTDDDISLFLTQHEKNNLKKNIFGRKFVYAPIKEGDVYGKIQYSAGERIVFEQDLAFGHDISEIYIEEQISFFDKIKEFFYNLI